MKHLLVLSVITVVLALLGGGLVELGMPRARSMANRASTKIGTMAGIGYAFMFLSFGGILAMSWYIGVRLNRWM